MERIYVAYINVNVHWHFSFVDSGQMVRMIKRPTSIEETGKMCRKWEKGRKRDKSLTMTTSRSWHSSDAVFRYLCRCQPDIHADTKKKDKSIWENWSLQFRSLQCLKNYLKCLMGKFTKMVQPRFGRWLVRTSAILVRFGVQSSRKGIYNIK